MGAVEKLNRLMFMAGRSNHNSCYMISRIIESVVTKEDTFVLVPKYEMIRIKNIIEVLGLNDEFKFYKSPNKIVCTKTKSRIEPYIFDANKIKGLEVDHFWCDEGPYERFVKSFIKVRK